MRWLWRRMPLVHAVLLGSACGVTDTDEPTPVDTVAVHRTTLELATGNTGALEATVTDGSGNVLRDRRVIWVSANPIHRDRVGQRRGDRREPRGKSTLQPRRKGNQAIANVTVLPLPARVTTVRIAPDKVDLFVAAGANLVATPFDSRGCADRVAEPSSGRRTTRSSLPSLRRAASQHSCPAPRLSRPSSTASPATRTCRVTLVPVCEGHDHACESVRRCGKNHDAHGTR